MGFTTVQGAQHEPSDSIQTPAEVKAVRERAGFKQVECDDACWFPRGTTAQAEFGINPLKDHQWQQMKRMCGSRVFDHE